MNKVLLHKVLVKFLPDKLNHKKNLKNSKQLLSIKFGCSSYFPNQMSSICLLSPGSPLLSFDWKCPAETWSRFESYLF